MACHCCDLPATGLEELSRIGFGPIEHGGSYYEHASAPTGGPGISDLAFADTWTDETTSDRQYATRTTVYTGIQNPDTVAPAGVGSGTLTKVETIDPDTGVVTTTWDGEIDMTTTWNPADYGEGGPNPSVVVEAYTGEDDPVTFTLNGATVAEGALPFPWGTNSWTEIFYSVDVILSDKLTRKWRYFTATCYLKLIFDDGDTILTPTGSDGLCVSSTFDASDDSTWNETGELDFSGTPTYSWLSSYTPPDDGTANGFPP